MNDALDFPFTACIEKAKKEVYPLGGQTLQKFTCAGCGQRLTIDVPNTWYEQGTCDRCKTTTNIKARGCNFMVIFGGTT